MSFKSLEEEYQWWSDRQDCLDASDRSEYLTLKKAEADRERKREIKRFAKGISKDSFIDDETGEFVKFSDTEWRHEQLSKESARKFAHLTVWELKLKKGTAFYASIYHENTSEFTEHDIFMELARRAATERTEDDGFDFLRNLFSDNKSE